MQYLTKKLVSRLHLTGPIVQLLPAWLAVILGAVGICALALSIATVRADGLASAPGRAQLGKHMRSLLIQYSDSRRAPDERGECVHHARWILTRLGYELKTNHGIEIPGLSRDEIERQIIPMALYGYPVGAGQKGVTLSKHAIDQEKADQLAAAKGEKALRDKLILPEGWHRVRPGSPNGVIFYNCNGTYGHVATIVNGMRYDDIRNRTGKSQPIEFNERGTTCKPVVQLCQEDWGCQTK